MALELPLFILQYSGASFSSSSLCTELFPATKNCGTVRCVLDGQFQIAGKVTEWLVNTVKHLAAPDIFVRSWGKQDRAKMKMSIVQTILCER